MKALGGLFGGAPAPTVIAPPPPPPPPAPMPSVDDAAVAAAKTRAIQAAQASSGRLSTIMGSGQGTADKLGA